MRKAVILDRDGTIIEDRIYLNDPDQVFFLPGVFEAMRMLRDKGYVFAVATNQSGVPRGLVDINNLYEIHRRIRATLCSEGIDILGFYYAPYMTDSNHPMRKPNTGMLEAAAKDFKLDLRKSWMAGDKMTDVEAGHRAGCRSILLGQIDPPETSHYTPPEVHTDTLLEAAEIICAIDDAESKYPSKASYRS